MKLCGRSQTKPILTQRPTDLSDGFLTRRKEEQI